jgi:hypothetical protein
LIGYFNNGRTGAILAGNSRIIIPVCPLCKTPAGDAFFFEKRRNYFQCSTWNLIFVPPEYFLSADDEKAEYDLHENKPDDPGYRRFLSRLFVPMHERIKAGSHGLDFGSGPGPTLSLMFEEAGHQMEIYDKFYAKNPDVLDQQFSFITATEVVEHLHHPGQTLDRLWECLKNGGWLGIMTKLSIGQKAFSQWHYKDDFTHVCFFSRGTFKWQADQWQADLVFIADDVVLIQKK